jgi:hypothetical protein
MGPLVALHRLCVKPHITQFPKRAVKSREQAVSGELGENLMAAIALALSLTESWHLGQELPVDL